MAKETVNLDVTVEAGAMRAAAAEMGYTKICFIGKPCGDSCILITNQCRVGPGRAVHWTTVIGYILSRGLWR